MWPQPSDNLPILQYPFYSFLSQVDGCGTHLLFDKGNLLNPHAIGYKNYCYSENSNNYIVAHSTKLTEV